MRWGELEEEDDSEDLDFVMVDQPELMLESAREILTDQDHHNATTRARKLANAGLRKQAVVLRSWLKFENAMRKDVGSRLIMVSTEEILIDQPMAPGGNPEEPKAAGDGNIVMICRNCSERGHLLD
ncbi:hypothetical protein FEM48_Zijuj02G0068200 [Ziziphus jujuba var. spinosa]|uniref:Uncharacterized protein n=1 Tax=Ziziphus jujuba var. spinosa TaxID=714518 RepID=A0A978VU93_ZIZJJ|nr:hypothetical protein FEM48_Zijuj02G0068200 [Ziziphus jujuba var. spinosa]